MIFFDNDNDNDEDYYGDDNDHHVLTKHLVIDIYNHDLF